jgi:hypothetical protein
VKTVLQEVPVRWVYVADHSRKDSMTC